MDLLDEMIARPLPEDSVQRIRTFARDLAEGAVNKLWASDLVITVQPGGGEAWYHVGVTADLFDQYIEKKWNNQPPLVLLMVSFDYMRHLRNELYLLTEKAFQLLERPVSIGVFISYSRKESSAFALLILARLKAVGLDAFLDMKDLAPGDEWHARLENEIKSRQYFICLIGKSTLESPYVRKEIEWAQAADCRTIPIWQPGFQLTEEVSADFEVFLNRNAVIIENENAKGYNNAVIEILNYFGYTPT